MRSRWARTSACASPRSATCARSSRRWASSAPARSSQATSSIELRVEGDGAALEVKFLDERARFGGAEFAVHAAVFPLDRERAGVVDVVEGDDDVLELDV